MKYCELLQKIQLCVYFWPLGSCNSKAAQRTMTHSTGHIHLLAAAIAVIGNHMKVSPRSHQCSQRHAKYK